MDRGKRQTASLVYKYGGAVGAKSATAMARGVAQTREP